MLMIRGVGIDMVYMDTIEKYLTSSNLGKPYVERTFTDAERIAAPENIQLQAEYYSSLFAVKEAVFKAIAHLTKAKTFDLRIIETLHHHDGSPYVNQNEHLTPLLKEAGVSSLHISITTEERFVIAFVIAEGDEPNDSRTGGQNVS